MKLDWVKRVLVLGVLGVANVACSSQGLEEEDGQLGSVSEAVTTSDFTDVSGRISVQVKTCDWSASSTDPESTCTTNAGWTLTGGGAEIEGEAAGGDRVLKASFPLQDSNQNTWVARSHGTDSHRIRAYVIGIKLFGLTETQVRSLRLINDSTTVVAAGQQTISIQSSSLMVGGGAVVLVPSAPGYLLESRPTASDRWEATINATGVGAGVKVYMIQFNPCPAQWSYCLANEIQEQTGSSGSGYTSKAFSPAQSPWIQTSIGGQATWSSGSGKRYLADLIPFNGGTTRGVTVRSRNVGTASGPTIASSVNLKLSGYPWLANDATFQSGGSLYRGANNRLQVFSWPQGNAWHWAFQEKTVGGSIYYLRNANPGYGGDCAYQTSAGSTTVSVGTTCTGTGAEWEVWSGTFQSSIILKNRLTNKCLDLNGNNGTTATDLATKTCSTVTGQQQFWLDWHSWP